MSLFHKNLYVNNQWIAKPLFSSPVGNKVAGRRQHRRQAGSG